MPKETGDWMIRELATVEGWGWGEGSSDDGALIRQPGTSSTIGCGRAPFGLRWLAVAAPMTPGAATAAHSHIILQQSRTYHFGGVPKHCCTPCQVFHLSHACRRGGGCWPWLALAAWSPSICRGGSEVFLTFAHRRSRRSQMILDFPVGTLRL